MSVYEWLDPLIGLGHDYSGRRLHPRRDAGRFSQPDEPRFVPFWRDRFIESRTERDEKSLYLVMGQGGVLVRAKFSFARREEHGKFASVTCMIEEIDGRPVSPEQQEQTKGTFRSEEAPDGQDQLRVLKEALAHFDITVPDAPLVVSEAYAEDYKKVRAMAARIVKKRRG